MIVCAGVARAADTPTPGLYSVYLEMESSLPIPVAPQTVTQCYTEEHFDQDPAKIVALQDGSGDDCEVISYSMGDGEMAMQMVCQTGAGEMAMVSEGTYDDDSFAFVSRMEIQAQGMTMEMTANNRGTRVGDCEG